MKIRLVIILILLVNLVHAQDFEGTIKWSMKMDITDPKMKKQMEEAEAKMKDPATQAQIKQAMEQMNTPEMKKAMEANPQLKAQLEALIKSQQGGGINSMMPTGMTLKTKNGSGLSMIEGGMMNGMETLHIKGKDESYLINRNSKTYSVISHAESKAVSNTDPKVIVKKTTETQKILNYTCTKTIVTVTEGKQTFNHILWTTNEIKGFDFKAFGDQSGENKQAQYYKDIDGAPLKMEMTMPQYKMVMEVTEIKRQSLPASDFVVPAGFAKAPLPGQ